MGVKPRALILFDDVHGDARPPELQTVGWSVGRRGGGPREVRTEARISGKRPVPTRSGAVAVCTALLKAPESP